MRHIYMIVKLMTVFWLSKVTLQFVSILRSKFTMRKI